MSLRPVARISELPTARGLRVEVDGLAIALFRVGDEVYAIEDVCPHQGVPLSDGDLEGCVITCRAHGWPFDVRTGFAPDDADGFPIPRFAVALRDEDVLVDPTRVLNDPRANRRRASTGARDGDGNDA